MRKDVPDVAVEMDVVPTVSVDLMYLCDKEVGTIFVAVDHESGCVCRCALKDKAVVSGTGWIQRRVAQDIDNAGHTNIKIRKRSDQERLKVALQKCKGQLARRRFQ